MHSTFPQLQVVALDALVLHEEADGDRVERLRRQLESSGILRNPPIAAPLEAGRFVLLDGATRVTALRTLGCRTAVVQVVDYPGTAVTLRTWAHFLPQWSLDELQQQAVSAGFRTHRISLAEAQRALAERTIIAYATSDGTYALGLQSSSPAPTAVLLRRLVSLYTGRGFQRVTAEEVSLLRQHSAQAAGLSIVFPDFTPEEIRRMALAGEKLPAGITRHIIAGRLLQANIPVEELRRVRTPEEQYRWLQHWWHERLRSHRLRYYPEPTFVLEE